MFETPDQLRSSSSRRCADIVARKGIKRTLRTEELARDVEGLAADHNDLLAVEKLLGNNAGKTTKEVALAIDDDLAEEVRLAIRFHQIVPQSNL